MTIHPANLHSPSRGPRLDAESLLALAGTAFSALLLLLTAMYAGPLWRDEVNTANLAQMPTWKAFGDSLPFESFPPLWPLVLRGCNGLGLAGTDAGIRLLGLGVGLGFLVSLWRCARWMGGRAPTLSVALLGSLPAFIFIIGANRAYGLASCLLVLSFGLIWRMVCVPSRARVFWCALVCLLFAQCVYYDVVFLGAMLAGAALVCLRRRQWRTLGMLTGIGAVSAASLLIYLPVIRRGSVYLPQIQIPFFDFPMLWQRLNDAVAARSSAHPPESASPEVWLWITLVLAGLIAAGAAQWRHRRPAQNPKAVAAVTDSHRADLALFCAVSLLLGIIGNLAFLVRLRFVTQTWYYIELLSLCAIALDGLLNANWPALRPWGLFRVGFMAAMIIHNAGPAWEEAHTRRSNVDLIAAVLNQTASPGDLIVVNGSWEGITFDRYYHGRAPWVTVPPVDSHKVHRNDLELEQMNQPDAMAPVLDEITDTLRGSNCVWLVGNLSVPYPKPARVAGQPPGWAGPYVHYWAAQLSVLLLRHTATGHPISISVDEPVSQFEDLPLLQFSGYKSGPD